METKTEEKLVNLQVVDSVTLKETLKLSPFFGTLSQSDIDDLMQEILNPPEMRSISSQRH